MSAISIRGAVTVSNRRTTIPVRRFLPEIIILAGLFVAGPALATHLVGNIELDGNTANDGGAIAGIDDWDDVFAAADNAVRSAFLVDSAAIDTTAFEGGVKDTQSLNQWTCIADSVQNKSDLLHAYAATYEVDGDLYFYGGGDRETTEGTANRHLVVAGTGIVRLRRPRDAVHRNPH